MPDDKNACYLLELLNSVLRNEQPKEPDTDVSLESVMKTAQQHSVANMAYYAVEQLSCAITDENRRSWAELRDMAIMKDITQQVEYEGIVSAFKEREIRFLPVKGFILKALYPQSDMRLMSDVDILIDKENAKTACDAMISIGYEVEEYGTGAHDVYHKKPVMSAEIHRELFEDECRDYAALFPDPWAVSQEHDGCYEMDTSSCFVYILAHALKHLDEGGTGIRTFMDIYLYYECYKSELDMDEIYGAFDGIGKGDICRDAVKLALSWFGGAPDSSIKSLEEYVLGSGTYGSYENTIRSTGKAKYIFRLIFPPFSRMRSQYPVLKKAPVLLPFCWLFRLVVKPFANFRQNSDKLKVLTKKQR